MGRKIFINKETSIKKIRKEKRKIKDNWELYEKLTFIEDLYHEETVKYAIEKRGRSTQTGHNWLKRWNEEGIEGLKRKEGSGKKAKLNDNDLIKLRKLILENNLTSKRQIRELIRTEFDVTYSLRHIGRIMEKLEFGYGKPYIIPAKSPNDASEQLKKTSNSMK